MFAVDLMHVELISQLRWNYCGPACAQMILNGYPSLSQVPELPEQNVLWEMIQENNVERPKEQDSMPYWFSDPQGLRKTIETIKTPKHGKWDLVTHQNSKVILKKIIRTMAANQYPVATLVDDGFHWVTVVGYEIDGDPFSGDPELKSIVICDPLPSRTGTVSVFNCDDETTATSSEDDPSWWSFWTPNQRGKIWKGKYIALVEQPDRPAEEDKKVKAFGMARKLITPEKAMETALRHVDRFRHRSSSPGFKALDSTSCKAFESPFLVHADLRPAVRELHGPLSPESRGSHYYIIPFGLDTDVSNDGSRQVHVTVMVNAYTGLPIGTTAFGRPTSYITEEKAIDIALESMGLNRNKRDDAAARLIFKPSGQSQVFAYPFWEVRVGEHTVFVDQERGVSNHVVPVTQPDSKRDP